MVTNRRAVLAGIGYAPLVAWGAAQAGRSENRVDAYMRERLAAKGIPGAGVAVVRDGRPVKRYGYGTGSLEFDVRVTADTVFPTASKPRSRTPSSQPPSEQGGASTVGR